MSAQIDNPHYERLGGAPMLRALVSRFYEVMDLLPEAYGIRKLHPADLSGSRDKLFMFLSGWLGGLQLYVKRFGHPRLRARHLPFAISEAERDQWLMCMQQAVEDVGVDPSLRAELAQAFFKMADHMRNQG
ncbi:MAG: group II truncated hemoglobin [Acidiferrobacterales bacterium]